MMSFPKLKTVIDNLEKARQDYIKKFGVEPTIWSIEAEDDRSKITLTDKVSRTRLGTKSHPQKMKTYAVKMPTVW